MPITPDFKRRTVGPQLILRADDDNWGPFEFDCSPGLPEGVTISSVTATCYNIAGEEEPNLIELNSVSVKDLTTVQLYFQVPAEVVVGDYHLFLTLTLSNGGVKNLAFGPITVEGW